MTQIVAFDPLNFVIFVFDVFFSNTLRPTSRSSPVRAGRFLASATPPEWKPKAESILRVFLAIYVWALRVARDHPSDLLLIARI